MQVQSDIESAKELLKKAYAYFNARNMNVILALMKPDVVWANGMDAVTSNIINRITITGPNVTPTFCVRNAERKITKERITITIGTVGKFGTKAIILLQRMQQK